MLQVFAAGDFHTVGEHTQSAATAIAFAGLVP
jgi:hypothetical protein